MRGSGCSEGAHGRGRHGDPGSRPSHIHTDACRSGQTAAGHGRCPCRASAGRGAAERWACCWFVLSSRLILHLSEIVKDRVDFGAPVTQSMCRRCPITASTNLAGAGAEHSSSKAMCETRVMLPIKTRTACQRPCRQSEMQAGNRGRHASVCDCRWRRSTARGGGAGRSHAGGRPGRGRGPRCRPAGLQAPAAADPGSEPSNQNRKNCLRGGYLWRAEHQLRHSPGSAAAGRPRVLSGLQYRTCMQRLVLAQGRQAACTRRTGGSCACRGMAHACRRCR